MIPFFLILYLKLEDIYSRLLNLQVFFEKILGTRDFGEQETVFLSTSCQLIDFLRLYSYFILGKALLHCRVATRPGNQGNPGMSGNRNVKKILEMS